MSEGYTLWKSLEEPEGTTESAEYKSGPNVAITLFSYGFDVFVNGNRGTLYNKRRADGKPARSTAAYWDFSYKEMGLNDVTASIELITNATGQSKMSYFGFSQGTM